jgi:hemin uptake protein HemP
VSARSDEPSNATAAVPPDEPQVRTVSATSLMGEQRVLRIEHLGEVYTLRITKNDRLLLTK